MQKLSPPEFGTLMKITEITPDMVFVLETSDSLPVMQQEHLLEQWNILFPDNKLLILKKDTLQIFKKSKQ